MAVSDAALQWLATVLVVLVPVGLLLASARRGRGLIIGVLSTGLVAAVASLTVSSLVSSTADLPARVLDAAFAAAVAASLVVLTARRLGSVGAAVFAGSWSLLVFQPVFVATMGSLPSLVQTVFGAVDYAAVHASHVAAATSVIALTMLPRPALENDLTPETGRGRSLIAAAFVAVGAMGWMLGVERIVSDATGRIALNALVGLALGAAVWVLTTRIAGRPFDARGVVWGVVTAWGAIGLGLAFLSPMALASTTVFAAAAAAAVVARGRAGADRGRRAAVAVIVAVSVGGVVLALLADGFGMAATGSTALVLGQLGAVLVIGIAAFMLGLLCGGMALVVVKGSTIRSSSRPSSRCG
ncbi:MAG: hypothetical protein KIT89_02875 [Microcella sp.]|uniref:hypothetical protein n=1 Tax=Microcella sp. TaxID=1913979 RepID=UPI0024C62E21|nr:hypothetical protein [Microcella sp.]UYN84171.1 MAG: hypothetical protein KIT89_02875 [Microcella sp.]